MSNITVPEFETYEDEANFWDNLDTADFMEDDGEWFHFETENQRAARVAILPEVLNSGTFSVCVVSPTRLNSITFFLNQHAPQDFT